MNQNILTIAQLFSHQQITSAEPFGNGNINDTYLVTDIKQQFILQQLNLTVFTAPHLIFANQLLLQKLLAQQPPHAKQIQIPKLILTCEGESHHRDKQNIWRAQEFIAHGQETAMLLQPQAESVGRLLGIFHKLGANQSSLDFHDTLPGLHVTSVHLQQYQHHLQSPIDPALQPCTFCTDCIDQYQDKAADIDQQLHAKAMPRRLIHGDPKLANILFDRTSNMACSLIDLDTIGPGLIHHDLSDLIRSCCNRAGEESRLEDISFDLELAKEILTGYSKETAIFLTPAEINLISKSLWIIPFELGIRFLNDYLAGSIYFKTSSPHQNLNRAQNQFKLAMEIEQNQAELTNHISRCFSFS